MQEGYGQAIRHTTDKVYIAVSLHKGRREVSRLALTDVVGQATGNEEVS